MSGGSSAERGRIEERERRESQERREAEGREEPTRREPEPPTKREVPAAGAAAARPALTISRFVGLDPPRLSASLSLVQEPPRVAPAPGPALVRFAGASPPKVSASPRPPAVPGPPPVRFSPAPTLALAASEARLESSLPIVPPRPTRAPAMEERAQAQSAAPSQLQGEAPGGEGEEELQEPKDFLEWILGGHAAGRISGGGPYVILYEEDAGREEGRGIPSDTVHLLERILVRRYREMIKEGEPRPLRVAGPEVLGGLKELPWDVDPARRIYRMRLGDLVKEGSMRE